MKKILYLDMDNVLVDFPSVFLHLTKDQEKEYVDRSVEQPVSLV